MNVSKTSAQKAWQRQTIPGEIILKLKSDTAVASELLADHGGKVLERFDLSTDGGDMLRIKTPSGQNQQDVLEALSSDERVSFAEPNYRFALPEFEKGQSLASESGAPNDLDSRLWGLENTGQTGGTSGADVNAKEAWKVSKGDRSDNGPLIAVIDTGIDYSHPDLHANMWVNPGEIPGDGIDNDGNGVVDDIHGYNAYADNGDPMDGHSHGTHCAGTIAAVGDNGIGITGVMQQANLMAIKIFSDRGTTSTDAIIRGIAYGEKMGADLTSNSWGSSAYSQAIFEAFRSHDTALHIMAAGNGGFDNDVRDNFPSNYELPNNLAVAATDHNDQKARFSQYGTTKVDVSAPGVDIYSTINGGGYDTYSGTSMATPHVTGGAGLLLSANPEMSIQELKDRLIYGSDKVTALSDVSRSDGRVDFAASLEKDGMAPGAPNDLEVRNLNARGLDLTWTSVGDDKWANGAAQTIEISVSSEPITEENLSQAPLFTTAGAAEVGDLHRWQYSALPQESERHLHFAMRSVDNVGNRSDVRYADAIIPKAEVAFARNFDETTVDFTAEGDFKLVDVDGRGKVFSTATDSSAPGGKLTSPVIDLSNTQGSYLKFDSESSLSWGEQAWLLISDDNGENWTTLSELNKNREWHTEGVDLAAYDGKKVQLRFSTLTRKGRPSKGIRVDNLRVLSE